MKIWKTDINYHLNSFTHANSLCVKPLRGGTLLNTGTFIRSHFMKANVYQI